MRLIKTILAMVLSFPLAAAAQSGWPNWGNDAGGTVYSPLTTITPANVSQLKPAWTYRYGAGAHEHGFLGGDYRFEVTPLVIGGVMYLSTPASELNKDVPSAVLALEPETGKVIWKYVSERRIYGRGIAYWPGDKTTGPRLFFGVSGAYMMALDARTGQPAAGFGTDGLIDVYSGVASANVDPIWRTRYTIPNPVTIYRNLIVTGARPGEIGPPGPRGDIRAWDARTGKLVWTFHTVPQPGEPHHDSWPGDSWKDRPGDNMWNLMTLDEKRGIVFASLGSVSVDYMGTNRPGMNLYGNSLVALDARTGKLIWYQQLIHHDLWDYDLPTPPTLIEVSRGSRKIPAVAQTGKTGLLFIFDRRTGQPLIPIEERKVPESKMPGDTSWPTQPFPARPAPLSRNTITRDEITDITPGQQAACTEIWDKNNLHNDGPFSLPGLGSNTIWFPGSLGGANWGAASYNPRLGLLFVNVMNRGAFGKILRQPDGSAEPYRVDTSVFVNPETGWPCQKPPWGELVAVDVNRGEIAWHVPLGSTKALGEKGLHTGALNMGGNLSTASGLVFIAATNDDRFRAFDAKTGRQLWEAEMEASGFATPMSYLGRDGKQYVVIAAGGGTAIGNGHISDTLLAFTLP